MAKLDSADLLAKCQRAAMRPTTDAQQSPADWYAFLSEAQDEYYNTFAAICPQVLYSPPTVMTTADGGLTYTFGVDSDGRNIFPMGSVEVRTSPNSSVLVPTTDWSNTGGFVQEGDHIRWPNGRKLTFGTTGPTARFIAPPGIIDDTHQPTLMPYSARLLLVYRACAKWARRGGLRDPQPFLDQEMEVWLGNPANGVMGILGMLKLQYGFSGNEGLGDEYGDARWWANINGSMNY